MTVDLPMICTCNTVGVSEGERLMADVMERLSAGTDQMAPSTVTMDNFLSTVVFSLNWDFGTSIVGIYNDMWSMVVAERYRDKMRVSVSCDEVEHGLAAIWRAFADGTVK